MLAMKSIVSNSFGSFPFLDLYITLEPYLYKLLEARVSRKSSLNEVKIDKIDVLLLDPPRDGLEERLIRLISGLNSKKVIYVSCNAATLARDLKVFDTLGYKTKSVCPIDMFPQTEHVETVVLMSRVSE